jgi:hypothetical protein
LVIDSAKAGKGDYCFVKESDMDSLKAKVISQLQRAAEPALVDCEFRFINQNKGPFNHNSKFMPGNMRFLGQLFRN